VPARWAALLGAGHRHGHCDARTTGSNVSVAAGSNIHQPKARVTALRRFLSFGMKITDFLWMMDTASAVSSESTKPKIPC